MSTPINIENPVVQAMNEGASRWHAEQPLRQYLGMSGIGDKCLRKIWYGFRGYTPTALEGRVQMIFSLGSAIEQEVLRWLRMGGYQIEEQQQEFQALNGFFRGHCDGVIDGVTQRRHVLEIKSASASRFKAFQTGTVAAVSPTYYAQLQCYMGYSGIDRGLWVVMNKDNCSIYVERLHYDERYFREIEERARNIINANREPERAFEEGSRECQWCSYQGHCWSPPYVQTHKTCGTCYSCRFENLTPTCIHHNHVIEKWGRACPDWKFRDTLDAVPF